MNDQPMPSSGGPQGSRDEGGPSPTRCIYDNLMFRLARSSEAEHWPLTVGGCATHFAALLEARQQIRATQQIHPLPESDKARDKSRGTNSSNNDKRGEGNRKKAATSEGVGSKRGKKNKKGKGKLVEDPGSDLSELDVALPVPVWESVSQQAGHTTSSSSRSGPSSGPSAALGSGGKLRHKTLEAAKIYLENGLENGLWAEAAECGGGSGGGSHIYNTLQSDILENKQFKQLLTALTTLSTEERNEAAHPVGTALLERLLRRQRFRVTYEKVKETKPKGGTLIDSPTSAQYRHTIEHKLIVVLIVLDPKAQSYMRNRKFPNWVSDEQISLYLAVFS